MDGGEEDDDLELVKASATLLSELERDLPKLLWKPRKPGQQERRAHSRIRQRDLNRIIGLIEPFQGEPQLLDAKLKTILPPIVDAYLQSLSQQFQRSEKHLDVETGVCCLLYTLCKVRGAKVVIGFLNNEPRYLESVLEALERTISTSETEEIRWEVPYVLLLWLSHLLLTPFDLTSISDKAVVVSPDGPNASLLKTLPNITARVLHIGLQYLPSPTKAQDAAAAMLVRLSIRPDVQKFGLADSLVKQRLPMLESNASSQDTYEMLGSLQFVAGVASSAELSHLVPDVYRSCQKAFDEDDTSSLSSSAVTKKIIVKVFRNVAILSLRSAATDGPLLDFLQTSGVLESVIDYLLRSLADKDTPVRYAAAKAISLIVLELEPEMGHEVIQAILDTFKEDIPRYATTVDLATANPLKWHGLTLTLAHSLFKRSASTEQLPDILEALITALQFQQRTATGSVLGTNVRDAANFGIWSLARRYTTAELLPIKAHDLHASIRTNSGISIMQHLATQLILTACLDPAGNIRRGASAALQELVGRHPDQVHDGIALVQIVDYQAVSLRSRAMIHVANNAAPLHLMYSQAVLDSLFGWRGLGSADVASRESAAASIAKLSSSRHFGDSDTVKRRLVTAVQKCPLHDAEPLHGLSLTAALLLRHRNQLPTSSAQLSSDDVIIFLELFNLTQAALNDFTSRIIRSELPASLARFIAELCSVIATTHQRKGLNGNFAEGASLEHIDTVAERLLARHEDTIVQATPDMARSLLRFKRQLNSPLGCVGAQTLSKQVISDASKSRLHGFGRVIALGALAMSYDSPELSSEKSKAAIPSLTGLMDAATVDWRVIGAKALQLVVDGAAGSVDTESAEAICQAIHRGMNDYTIDERGDVGSLVRLQCITCAWKMFDPSPFRRHPSLLSILEADIYRLSLEKLDRVRHHASQCLSQHLDVEHPWTDIAGVSSPEYFIAALHHLKTDSYPWVRRSLLEGCISCAGVAGEAILQNSREALAFHLDAVPLSRLEELMTIFATILKDLAASTPNMQPALEVLAYLLDMQIPQRLSSNTGFKFRNLLSTVQKSHHKSNDVPKILAAVHVYIGLADVGSIREEVLKKLISMLKTNPYPRVRIAVAEGLWVITREESLKNCDWTRASADNQSVVEGLRTKFGCT